MLRCSFVNKYIGAKVEGDSHTEKSFCRFCKQVYRSEGAGDMNNNNNMLSFNSIFNSILMPNSVSNNICNVLIPIASFLMIALFLFGLRKIVSERSLSTVFSSESKDMRKSRIYFKFLDVYRKNLKSRMFLLFVIFISLSITSYLFFENLIFSLFVSACVIILFTDLLKGIEDRRKDLLHSQLIEFINVMVIMLRAGRTIRNVIRDSVKWLKSPLRDYIERLAKELELNFTMDEALERFSKNCGTKEAKLLASALKINNQIGGDLIFILNNIADTLRSSFKIRSQIKTLTLQSRFSGNIISFFPILVLSGLFIFMNSAVKAFFSSSVGSILLIIGGVFEIAGIAVIRNILKADAQS